MNSWTSILPPEQHAMTITGDDIFKLATALATVVILVLQILGKIKATARHDEVTTALTKITPKS